MGQGAPGRHPESRRDRGPLRHDGVGADHPARARPGSSREFRRGPLSWAHADQVARAHIAAVDHARPGERYLLGGADATMRRGGRHHGRAHGKEGPRAPDAAVGPSYARSPLAVGLARHAPAARSDPGDRLAHVATAPLLSQRQGDRRAWLPARAARRHAARVVRVAEEREPPRPRRAAERSAEPCAFVTC